ncbi:hypothetical protein [Nocardia sp. NPDC004711]
MWKAEPGWGVDSAADHTINPEAPNSVSLFDRSKSSGCLPQAGESLAEVPDLPMNLREFDLDGLVGFVVSPLAAPENQAFGVVLEFREEHTRLGGFGIVTHRRLVSAGCRKPPQCAALDQ